MWITANSLNKIKPGDLEAYQPVINTPYQDTLFLCTGVCVQQYEPIFCAQAWGFSNMHVFIPTVRPKTPQSRPKAAQSRPLHSPKPSQGGHHPPKAFPRRPQVAPPTQHPPTHPTNKYKLLAITLLIMFRTELYGVGHVLIVITDLFCLLVVHCSVFYTNPLQN